MRRDLSRAARRGGRRPGTLILAGVLPLAAPCGLSASQLDASCVVSALNRTTRVLEDGSWILPNVPSSFGQIRVRASCLAGGVVRSAQSALFTLPPGGAVRVTDLDFEAPEAVPSRLSLEGGDGRLEGVGDSARLRAVATYPDGSIADVTAAAAGTTYRSSNPDVAEVSADGVVTARASGTVLLNATNEGALGVLQMQVIAAADSDGDGLPDDLEIANGLDPNDDSDAWLDLDGDGLSTAEELERGLDPFAADSDGDGLEDGAEVAATGTDPRLFDTDGDGVSDGLELSVGTDPLDSGSFELGEILVGLQVLPSTFVIVADAVEAEATVQLAVRGDLVDGSAIDLTARSRGTTYVSDDLEVCSFGARSGLVFGGRPGQCRISVANAGRGAAAEGTVHTFSPILVSSVPVPGSGNAVEVADGRVYVAAGAEGLQIFDLTSPRLPAVVASAATAGNAWDLVVMGERVHIAAGAAGVETVDVSDPSGPRRVGSLALADRARSLAADGTLLAVGGESGRLFLVDATAPDGLVPRGSVPTLGVPLSVAVDASGSLAFVAEGQDGIEVVDVSDPSAPAVVGRLVTGDARGLELVPPFLLVADFSNSFTVVDVENPRTPFVTASTDRLLTGLPVDVALFPPFAFTADIGFFAEESVPIIDVSAPGAPLPRALLPLPTGDPGRAVDADASYVYLLACDGCDGVGGDTHLDVGQYRSLEDGLGLVPSVALTSPRDGDVVTAQAPLTVTAIAEDDVGVLAVDFLVDGVAAGRDSTPPYGVTFAVPGAAPRVTLGARAIDFGGNQALAPEIEILVMQPGFTRVRGTVVDAGGAPVSGARVTLEARARAMSGPDGEFVFDEVTISGAPIEVLASALLAGRKYRGASRSTVPLPGATTDVGAIRLEPMTLLYPGPRVLTGHTAIDGAAADYDGDGATDLALIHTSPNEGTVLARGRGDGRFLPSRRLPLPGSFIAAGDLSLDGALDLVASHAGEGRVGVALNDGGGSFEIGASFAVGSSPGKARIGDLNRDGLPDVVVANRQSGDVSVLLGRGDGSFEPQTRFAVGGGPEDLALHDLDLDGRLDLAVTSLDDASLSVLLGDGDGGFAPATVLSFDLATRRVSAGDFDGNGVPDLAVAAGRFSDEQRLFVELGLGAGTFALASSLGAAILGEPISMASSDFDGDGTLDVAIGRRRSGCDGVRILRGDGTGGFPFALAGGFLDACELRAILSLRADADGLEDLVVVDGAGGATIYLAAGGGSFEGRIRVPGRGAPGALAADSDLDGDGNLDLAYLDSSFSRFLHVQRGRGDGTFSAVETATTAVLGRALAVGDLDGDGDADAVVAALDEMAVLLANGDGTFAPPILIPVPRTLVGLVVADVSGDGGADVVAVNARTDTVLVYEGLGDGSFDVQPPLPAGDGPAGLAVEDLDGDGSLDLAVPNRFSNDVSVFTSGAQTRHPAGDTPVAIAAGDLDLDGAMDLVVANRPALASGSDGVSVLLGDGTGSFRPPVHHPTGGDPSDLLIVDADVDGILDLVLLNRSNDDVSVLLGLGDGAFLPPERVRAGTGPLALGAGDFDGDGLPDLVTSDANEGGFSVILHR